MNSGHSPALEVLVVPWGPDELCIHPASKRHQSSHLPCPGSEAHLPTPQQRDSLSADCLWALHCNAEHHTQPRLLSGIQVQMSIQAPSDPSTGPGALALGGALMGQVHKRGAKSLSQLPGLKG